MSMMYCEARQGMRGRGEGAFDGAWIGLPKESISLEAA